MAMNSAVSLPPPTMPAGETDPTLPYQSKWLADRSPVKIFVKSRRIGISWAEAFDAVSLASRQRGANCFYISYNKEMTEGFVQDCLFWVKTLRQAEPELLEEEFKETRPGSPDGVRVQSFKLKFNSGYMIQTFSSTPRNLRSKGRPRERLIVDEAAFCESLSEIHKAGMSFINWRGEVRFISTHNGADSLFAEWVSECEKGLRDWSLHRVSFDDALAQGFFKRVCLVTGEKWSPELEKGYRAAIIKAHGENADEELFCIPTAGADSYFPRALVEGCMVEGPIISWEGSSSFNAKPLPERAAGCADWISRRLDPLLADIDSSAEWGFGLDFARTSDLTVLAPMQCTSGLARSVPFLVELRNIPFQQQQQIVVAVLSRLGRFRACLDARGNGQQIAEAMLDKFGTGVECVMLTEPYYAENFPRYKAALQDRAIELPRSSEVIADHRAIRLVNKVPRVFPTRGSRGRRHADAAVALMLAYASTLRAIAEPEFSAARPRRSLHLLDRVRRGTRFGGFHHA